MSEIFTQSKVIIGSVEVAGFDDKIAWFREVSMTLEEMQEVVQELTIALGVAAGDGQ